MLLAAAIVLLTLIALLAVPVTLRFRVLWPQALEQDVRLRWAFIDVRVRTPRPRRQESGPQDEVTESVRHRIRRTGRSSNRGGQRVLVALRQRGLQRRLVRFARDAWRAVHKRDLRLRIRIGLGDPASTGQLWAIAGPMTGMLSAIRDASIGLEPDFLESSFEIEASGSVRLMPLRFIFLAGGLLLSPSVWLGIHQVSRTTR